MLARSVAKKAAAASNQFPSWVNNIKFLGKGGRRVEIISPSLCDDALHRLAPSLPAPNTCDLIDVNPGTCLWSTKLHKILKPRRHVLVEPRRKDYSAFLNPLLNRASSKFTYAPTLQDALDVQNDYLSRDVRDYSDDALKPASINPHLLLSINLADTISITASYRGSFARHFMSDYYMSMLGLQSKIHRYGLVRVLAWLPDEDVAAYMPRAVFRRSKQAIQYELASTVQEVAGSGTTWLEDTIFSRRRWYDLEVEELAAVNKREIQAGITVPENRQIKLAPPPILSSRDIDIDKLRNREYSVDRKTWSDFVALDDEIKTKFPEWHSLALKKRTAGSSQPQGNKEQRRWANFFSHQRALHNARTRALEVLRQQRELEKEWRNIRDLNLPYPEERSKIDDLEVRAKEIMKQLSRQSVNSQHFMTKTMDDYRVSDMKPPAMSWSRRQFNPLQVHKKEFYPDRQLALLDITPNPTFVALLNTHEKRICFDYVLSRLTARIGSSVPEALSQIVPGGLDDFLEMIPNLRDPAKGGWFDLANLRVRSLPAELILEIAQAFEKWPFRPSTEELMMTIIPGADSFASSENA